MSSTTMPAASSAAPRGWGTGSLDGAAADLRRRYPTIDDLQAASQRRMPKLAYDFVAGGVGHGAPNVAANRSALDAVRIIPRYGLDLSGLTTQVTLFGRQYNQPVGVAPMGSIGLARPGLDLMLARAAQRAGIPYVSSTVANVAMEQLAAAAPDVFWFQLYGAPGNDHALSIDLVRRAEAAGAHVLLLTVDVPARQKRVHDIRNGLVVPFRFRPHTVMDIARRPAWALDVLRQGQPRFENFTKYTGPTASTGEVAGFVYQHMAGSLTWEAIARLRDIWPRALVVKGIMHPDDADYAVQLGADGVLVSNHGGRQLDAAPAAIDMLPAIANRVRGRATVLFDSGIRSGLDVLRALALGADATLSGRAFLWGGAALGQQGADHVCAMYAEEIRGVFGQAGVLSPEAAQEAAVLHPNAVQFG